MTQESRHLLVVADDPGTRRQLRWCFDEYALTFAPDRTSAVTAMRRRPSPVVVLDLALPPEPESAVEGLRCLDQLLDISPDTKVIVVTGGDEHEIAVEAVARGASEVCTKPFDLQVLSLLVSRAYRLVQFQRERAQADALRTHPLPGVVGESPQMLRLCETVKRVADTGISLLILGESGTGKELFARAIHQASGRAAHEFVAINCAAIPENLLESELFGYEKGAFTGATKTTPGRIEFAHKGTLFLDELGDLPLSLQAKLLRFLQERIIERVGGREGIPVDVRIISATNRDLTALIARGSFRDDLYYRLSQLTIELPPLRERDGDAALLAHRFLGRFSRELGRGSKRFSVEALQTIEAYSWPGNVRELENRVRRAVVMADDATVTAEALGFTPKEGTGDESPVTLRQARAQAERQTLRRALLLVGNNLSAAAQLLDISRPTLYDLLNKHGLR